MKYCKEYAALLDAFADGECTPEEAAQVQAHLDSCEGCRAYLDEILLMKAAFPDVEHTQIPDGFAESVTAMIRANTVPQKKRRSRWARLVLPAAACLAVLVVAVKLPSALSSGSTASDAASKIAVASSDIKDSPASSSASAAGTGFGNTAAASSDGSGGTAADSRQAGASEASKPRSKSDAPVQKKAAANNFTASSSTPDTKGETAANEPAVTSGATSNGTDSAETPKMKAASSETPENGTDAGEETILGQADANEAITSEKAYYKQASVSAQEIGSLLDGYDGVESEDPETGAAATTYELSEKEFDAIIAQIPDVQVTVTGDAGTDLCCIVVTS